MSKDKYFPDHYFLSIFFCPEVFIYKQYHSKSLFMPSVCGSNICLVLNTFTFKFKIISHAHWVWQITALIQGLITNIARGTTDPGYWVHNLNDLFQPKSFQTYFSQKNDSSYRLNTLGPLCLWFGSSLYIFVLSGTYLNFLVLLVVLSYFLVRFWIFWYFW